MTPFSIAFTATNSFVPSAPTQRQYILNNTNPNYLRYTYMTQDSLYFNVNGIGQAVIPLNGSGGLWASAITALPALTWPPVIATQPVNTTVTHPSSSNFFISASSETGVITYSWYSQSFGSSTWSQLSNTALYSGSTSPALTHSLTNTGDSGSAYFCTATNGSGQTSSSVAYLYVN